MLQEHPNNLFIPRKGIIYLLNNLPPELLSRIFQVGTWSHDYHDNQDKDGMIDAQDFLRELDAKRAHERNVYDSDVEVVGEELEEVGEEESEEEEGEEWVGEGDEETDAKSCSRDASFEIVVSHVCRHWRKVALSTPSLWTTIAVPSEARPPYERVSTLLQRSKSLPVDIHVKIDVFGDESTPDEHLGFLFAMLLPHVHRWRTMQFPVIKDHRVYELVTALSDPSIPVASQLRTFQLYSLAGAFNFHSPPTTFTPPQKPKHSILFGGSAPLLTKLVLWGVHIDWSQPWMVSASNLTDLDLSFLVEAVRPSWAQFTAILRGAPALEKLTLYGSGPSGDPGEWFLEPTHGGPADLNAPIQLPRVIKLVIGYNSQARATELIRNLHLPALKHLSLCFDGGDFTDLVHELARPVATAQGRSRSLLSKLESLKLKRLPCDIGCIDKLYGELQNLTSLNIWISPPSLSRFFLDLLAIGRLAGHDSQARLPRLVTLRVSGASGEDLREVVKSRKEAGVPLGSLYVEKSKEVTYKDVVWLMQNVKTLRFFVIDMD